MKYFRVRNLEKWQHYKDRNPPWIKLHRDVFNNYDFSDLEDYEKAHVIFIWLLASQMNNKMPYDPAWIKKRINAKEDINLDKFIGVNFFELCKE